MHQAPSTKHYRMPAEWEPHAATWLAWPHNKNDWPGKFEPIPWVYADIIHHLSQSERVRLVVRGPREDEKARDVLERAGVDLKKIEFFRIPTNRVWLRDSGPIFVRDSKNKKVMLDWRFNAWAKYDNYALDDRVPSRIEDYLGYARVQPLFKGRRVVLEGGAIDVNGKGALLTTEECLLSKTQQRNRHMTREDYEAVFNEYLGISDTIWLGKGIKGDDTHGHVDDLARFVSADTIVTVVEKNRKSDNYAPLQDNLKRLKKTKFTVAELPMPAERRFEDTLLPASYANFLIGNSVVLAPTFNDPNDRVALSILAELFPKREVIGIHCLDLVWGFGTLHCMSQQEPV